KANPVAWRKTVAAGVKRQFDLDRLARLQRLRIGVAVAVRKVEHAVADARSSAVRMHVDKTDGKVAERSIAGKRQPHNRLAEDDTCSGTNPAIEGQRSGITNALLARLSGVRLEREDLPCGCARI